ncbi:MAG: hypothetical protein KF787_02245 [Phycisphaeraceae bacterium]|nr:hypothetical protein [Phycisphaerae bacterium]MBX3391445.1 hypothetical protein [Phycisphaeraceae bacterium]
MHLRAHAKVNLALSVGGPLPPGSAGAGFHPIASWMACLDLHDDVTVEALPASSVSSYDIAWASDAPRPTPIDWPIESDLMVRAHRRLEASLGRSLPVKITLRKRIPVGGGLGGGSSDAATVILGVRRAYELDPDPSVIAAAAESIGSDVPFFLDADADPPRPALVTGLGERVERVPTVPASAILVIPPFSCPTAEVYKALDREPSFEPLPAPNVGLVRLLIRRAVESGRIDPSTCFNALTAPSCLVEPRLSAVIEAVTAIGGQQAHLSGSGSGVFIVGPAELVHEAQVRLSTNLSDHPVLAGCRVLRSMLV